MTGVTAIMAGMRSVGGIVFTPDGGLSSGAPVALSATSFSGSATVTITCSEAATWNWTRTGNTANSSATVASGGSATSITFTLTFQAGQNRQTVFTVDAFASDFVVKYWIVTLETNGL